MSRCQGLSFNRAILLLCQPPTWTLSLPVPSYFPDDVFLLPKRQLSLFLTAFELLCLLPEILWTFKCFLDVWMLFTSSLSGNFYSQPTLIFFSLRYHCHPELLSIISIPIVVVQLLSRVWLRDPMDCSTPGSSVFHCLPELAQIHVHWINDAIQPSCPLLPPFSPVLNLSQHQGLFYQLPMGNF